MPGHVRKRQQWGGTFAGQKECTYKFYKESNEAMVTLNGLELHPSHRKWKLFIPLNNAVMVLKAWMKEVPMFAIKCKWAMYVVQRKSVLKNNGVMKRVLTHSFKKRALPCLADHNYTTRYSTLFPNATTLHLQCNNIAPYKSEFVEEVHVFGFQFDMTHVSFALSKLHFIDIEIWLQRKKWK